MTTYYEGNPEMTCPKGCKSQCLLDCYIEIHQSMIGDDMKTYEFKNKYIRDEEVYCCGRATSQLDNGNDFCSVCGNEYKN